MRILVPLAGALILLVPPLRAQSDTEVKGAVATQFTHTKGASLLGQSIHWHVGAKVFSLPKKSREAWPSTSRRESAFSPTRSRTRSRRSVGEAARPVSGAASLGSRRRTGNPEILRTRSW